MAIIRWFYENKRVPLSVMRVTVLKMSAGCAPRGVGGETHLSRDGATLITALADK